MVNKKCPHGRVKSNCRECGGSSICPHDRIKYQCRDCGGSRICEHGRSKFHCRDCKGSSICVHTKQRNKCRDCNGSSFCTHGRIKHACKDCDGASFCTHGKRRVCCVVCDGISMCNHGRQKRLCRECKGSGLCEHNNVKGRCTKCPIDNITSSNICTICKMKHVKRANGMCASCTTVKQERIEHIFGNMIIEQVGHPPNSKDMSIVDTGICGNLDRRRPDLLWIIPGKRAVVIEIDEDSHAYRNPSCEVRKISEQNLAIQGIPEMSYNPVITFRVNPDHCDIDDSTLEKRALVIGGMVKKYLYQGDQTEVIFCYYHTKSNKHIEEHKKTWKCTIIP